MQYLGNFAEDATVYIPFNTFSSDDPQASVTITNLVDADVKVHKDGGLTQIATDGATVSIDFDGITGNHLITIDTSAHADYAIGSDYIVRIEGTTVDAGTINAFIGSFSIENRYDQQTADHTAGIADIPTVAEFNARTLLAADYFDPAADTVANVTTVATTTTNTDMRGTDSASLASVCTEPRLAELDAANLPADVAAIPTTAMRGTDNAATATNLATVDTNVDSILVDTATTIPALIAALNDLAASDILTTQLSESYAADGAAPTLTQALMLIQQALTEFSYATTLNTVKRLDGSTTAAVMTLDDATTPTSSTRTS